MSRTNKRFSYLSVALAATLALPVLAHSDTAEADVRVRVRARARAKAHVAPRVRAHAGVRTRDYRRGRVPVRRHYRVRPHRVYRPYYYGTAGFGVGLHVGGSAYWGPYYRTRFAAPPPAAYDCGPSVPAYYTYPSQASAPTIISGPAPAPLPDLPRFGIGAFIGGVDAESSPGASDVGLLARLRLTERLSLEAELAKTEIETGSRVDRRLGGGVVYDLAPRATWSLHLLGGLGVQQVDMGRGAWQSAQEYGELGAGLTYRITPSLHLSADLRAGVRAPVDDIAPDSFKAIAPSSETEDAFTRGRLSAILHF